MTTLSPSSAIKAARERVSSLYRLGDAWTYTTWDPNRSAWREAVPERDYRKATAYRRAAVTREAVLILAEKCCTDAEDAYLLAERAAQDTLEGWTALEAIRRNAPEPAPVL